MPKYQYRGLFSEYTRLVQDLDFTYGGPHYTARKAIKGRKALLLIFNYLSTHRKSTCEDIAEHDFKNNPAKKRKLKSVTDDIRKFVTSNLLNRKVIKEEGFKKKGNKKIQAYSLTHTGVLYAIHLLSINKQDKTVVKNMALEYPEYLPLVFDKLKDFEDILGKDYLKIIRIHDIAEKGWDIGYGSQDPVDFLNSYGRRAWIRLNDFTPIEDVWGDDVALLVYNNIFDHFWIEGVLQGYVPVKGESHKGRIGMYDEICKKITGNNSKLLQWYRTFVEQAIKDSKDRTKMLMDFKKHILPRKI